MKESDSSCIYILDKWFGLMTMKKVVLFGSIASGEYVDGKSDVDVALVFESELEKRRAKVHVETMIKNSRVDLFPEYTGGGGQLAYPHLHFLLMTESEYQDTSSPLTNSVRRGFELQN